MLRALLHGLLRFLFAVLARVETEGLENIPRTGGVIIAVNHLSYLDAPLVFALSDRKDLTAMVADKYLKKPLFRFVVNAVNGIWINRESTDFAALRAARDYLRNGGAMGIAPEGTRSPDGQLLEAKTGVAYLAEKAGVPVVPVAITGTHHGIRRMAGLQFPRIKVVAGEPFYVPPFDRSGRAEALQRSTDEIMLRLAALLPEAYRGYYKDHPRLSEFLS